MPSSVSDPSVRTLANDLLGPSSSIRTRPAKARIDAKSVENTPDLRPFRALVREAMRLVDLSNKAFAINAGQPESVISEALTGSRHLAAEWVWAQPDTFMSTLIDLIQNERAIGERADEIEADMIGQLLGRILAFTRRRQA
jgi:hypothetical protein